MVVKPNYLKIKSTSLISGLQIELDSEIVLSLSIHFCVCAHVCAYIYRVIQLVKYLTGLIGRIFSDYQNCWRGVTWCIHIYSFQEEFSGLVKRYLVTKGRISCVSSVWVQLCCMIYISTKLSLVQFHRESCDLLKVSWSLWAFLCSLENKDNSCLIGLLWELNETMWVKQFAQLLAHIKK